MSRVAHHAFRCLSVCVRMSDGACALRHRVSRRKLGVADELVNNFCR